MNAPYHVQSMASALACLSNGCHTLPRAHCLPHRPADVSRALSLHGYLPDDGLATSVFLALALKRPLLLEGEAGVGKTEVAKVISRWTGGELIRLQCYEGIDAARKPSTTGTTRVSSCTSAQPRPAARRAASAPACWRSSCTTNASC